jgi:hypothetical protein
MNIIYHSVASEKDLTLYPARSKALCDFIAGLLNLLLILDSKGHPKLDLKLEHLGRQPGLITEPDAIQAFTKRVPLAYKIKGQLLIQPIKLFPRQQQHHRELPLARIQHVFPKGLDIVPEQADRVNQDFFLAVLEPVDLVFLYVLEVVGQSTQRRAFPDC